MKREAIAIRSFASSEWEVYRELRLRALADTPDAFGSTFASESTHTDIEWQSRLNLGVSSGFDLPLVAAQAGKDIGLAWVKRDAGDGSTAHLYQMWVVPESRGQGVGSKLVAAAVHWLRQHAVHRLVLGATCGNTPAMRLYLKQGFRPRGAPQPLRPGSSLLSQPMVLQVDAPAV